jgi:hypothetical protein
VLPLWRSWNRSRRHDVAHELEAVELDVRKHGC